MIADSTRNVPFHQAAVAEGDAPAGLPVKKSGTAPSLTQTEVSPLQRCALDIFLPGC